MTFFRKTISCFIIVAFLATSVSLPVPGYAQSLPAVQPSAVVLTPAYAPAMIKGITVFPENPLQLDFIVDSGDGHLTGAALKNESQKLIQYFLASLTIPEDQMWVNLSPNEPDRIIPQAFGQTQMGRDLLAQDYLLKQLMASLMNPQERLGDEFWQKVYKKAHEQYGITDIPLDSFNKVWIMPDTADVYINGTNVFVVNSRLKVVLEEDYLAISDQHSVISQEDKALTAESRTLTATLIKEVILPEIEREVNEGKTFTNLRQIYHSMILAVWYKNNLKESLLGEVYVNQAKTQGVDHKDRQANQKIYQQYLQAFKKGAYDYIKEEYDPSTQELIPRKYFSGGINNTAVAEQLNEVIQPQANTLKPDGAMMSVRVSIDAVTDEAMLVDSIQQEIWELEKSKLPTFEEAAEFLEQTAFPVLVKRPGEVIPDASSPLAVKGSVDTQKNRVFVEYVSKLDLHKDGVIESTPVEISNPSDLLIAFMEAINQTRKKDPTEFDHHFLTRQAEQLISAKLVEFAARAIEIAQANNTSNAHVPAIEDLKDFFGYTFAIDLKILKNGKKGKSKVRLIAKPRERNVMTADGVVVVRKVTFDGSDSEHEILEIETNNAAEVLDAFMQKIFEFEKGRSLTKEHVLTTGMIEAICHTLAELAGQALKAIPLSARIETSQHAEQDSASTLLDGEQTLEGAFQKLKEIIRGQSGNRPVRNPERSVVLRVKSFEGVLDIVDNIAQDADLRQTIFEFSDETEEMTQTHLSTRLLLVHRKARTTSERYYRLKEGESVQTNEALFIRRNLYSYRDSLELVYERFRDNGDVESSKFTLQGNWIALLNEYFESIQSVTTEHRGEIVLENTQSPRVQVALEFNVVQGVGHFIRVIPDRTKGSRGLAEQIVKIFIGVGAVKESANFALPERLEASQEAADAAMSSEGSQQPRKKRKGRSKTLDRLLANRNPAGVGIWSDDKELGDIVRPGRFRSDRKSEFVPAPLDGLIEQDFMWKTIRNPLTDLDQITQRQDLIEALTQSGQLEKITQLKNASYLVQEGIDGLFQLVGKSEYDREPAIMVYRRTGEYRSVVMAALADLERGKKALKELAQSLLDFASPVVEDVGVSLQADVQRLHPFNNEYFLESKEFDQYRVKSVAQKVFNHVVFFGALVEFANIAVRENYARATYNQDSPFGYKQGWSFVREKQGEDPQVLNDAPLDKPIVILSGSNMGGKSFNLMQSFYIQLLAQSFGYIPAQEGNFEFFDSFLYLDRASTESSRNLSAYGAEIAHWIEALAQKGQKPFIFVDEGFSTTSAEDQYAMLMGIAEHVKKHGGRIIFTTHNEYFIDQLKNDNDVVVYHFPFEMEGDKPVMDEEDNPKFTHKLTEGAGDSHALEVAEALGLPEELLQLARDYLDGRLEAVEPPSERTFRSLVRYTEKEREALKTQNGSGLISHASEDARLLQLFSEDRDFKYGWFGSRIDTGEEGESINFGGWRPPNYQNRTVAILTLLTRNQSLDAKEILERQRMFEALSSNDRYKEFREIGDRLYWIFKFFPMINRVFQNGELTRLNIAVAPNSRDDRIRYGRGGVLYFLNFLSLNKKVLGDDFPQHMNELVERLQKLNEIFIIYGRLSTEQSVDEIEQAQEDNYDEEITDPQIVEGYLNLTPDEPKREQWKGKLTRRRIKAYMSWLAEADEEKFREVEWNVKRNNELRVLINKVMQGYSSITIIDRYGDGKDFDAQALKEEYFELADVEPQELKNKWGQELSRQRIKEYRQHLEQDPSGNDHRGRLHRLQKLDDQIRHTQSKLNIKDARVNQLFDEVFDPQGRRNGRISYEHIGEEVGYFLKSLDGLSMSFPARSIFEVDLDSIAEEIRYIAAHYRQEHKNRDYDHDSHWDNNLLAILILEMMVDGRNYFQEMIDLLRSYDSVHLNQYANLLEERLERFVAIGKNDRWGFRDFDYIDDFGLDKQDIEVAKEYFENKKDSLKHLVSPEELDAIERELQEGSSEKLFDVLGRYRAMGPKRALEIGRDVFANTLKPMWDDYFIVQQAFAQIYGDHPVARSEYGRIQYIRRIVENVSAQDHDGMADVLDAYFQMGLGDANRKFWPLRDLPEEERLQKEREAFKDFVDHELIESGLLEEFREILRKVEIAAQKAEDFVARHGIVFKSRDSRSDAGQEAVESFHLGKIGPLEVIMRKKLSDSIQSVLAISQNEDYIAGLNRLIVTIQAIALFGHMIARDGYAKVEFNEDGRVELKNMFSLFMGKDEQVSNDAHFDRDEYVRLLEAPNMSGKTFYLKALTMAILSALNTGYAPAEAATLPLFERVIYLDRVTTKLDMNLSALGTEVEYWKKFFAILKEEMSVFTVGLIDEAFSTTSPRYQSALMYAVVMELIRRGQYAAIASHNHDVLEVLHELEKDLVRRFKFEIKIDEEGKVVFDHKLKELEIGEESFSEAIPVARTLGMPEEILQTAQQVKDKIGFNDAAIVAAAQMIKLPTGATFLSTQDDEIIRTVLEGEGEGYEIVTTPEGSRLKPLFEGRWPTTSTNFSDMDRMLDLRSKIIEFDQSRRERGDPDEPIVILDWGYGTGFALKELKDEVERIGIRNVHLIGYADAFYTRGWANQDRASGIAFIFDTAENLEANLKRYFEERNISTGVHLVYSNFGLRYLNRSSHEAMLEHFKQLRRLLADTGEIRVSTDELPPSKYLQVLTQAGLEAEVIEEESIKGRRYLKIRSAGEISDAAMVGTDPTWDDLAREGYRFELKKDESTPGLYVGELTYKGDVIANSDDIRVYLFPDQKIILLTDFYPNFPDKTSPEYIPGRGRALLRQMFSSEEFAEHYILTNAQLAFRKSLKHLTDYHIAGAEPHELGPKPSNFLYGLLQKIKQSLKFYKLESDLRGILEEMFSEATVVLQVPAADHSMTPQAPGGVDLNPKHLDLRTQGDRIKMSVPDHLQYLRSQPINGFKPVIIHIQPAYLPMLLGLDGPDSGPKEQRTSPQPLAFSRN